MLDHVHLMLSWEGADLAVSFFSVPTVLLRAGSSTLKHINQTWLQQHTRIQMTTLCWFSLLQDKAGTLCRWMEEPWPSLCLSNSWSWCDLPRGSHWRGREWRVLHGHTARLPARSFQPGKPGCDGRRAGWPAKATRTERNWLKQRLNS